MWIFLPQEEQTGDYSYLFNSSVIPGQPSLRCLRLVPHSYKVAVAVPALLSMFKEGRMGESL